MAFIKWTKQLSIGIKDIDSQHKHFVELINQANNAHLNKNKNLMEDTLNELIEYTRIHFSTEEDYFRKWNYPDMNEHMIEHEKLMLKTLEFHYLFDNGKCNCEKFLNFLKDWLENHLKKYDFKYRDYFKEKGFI